MADEGIHQGQIDALSVRFTNLENRMNLESSRITSLEERVTTLEERQAALANDIANILALLERVVGSIEMGVDTKKAPLSELIERIDELGGNLTSPRV